MDWTPRDLTDYRTRVRCWYEVRNGRLVDMLSPWERFKAWGRRLWPW